MKTRTRQRHPNRKSTCTEHGVDSLMDPFVQQLADLCHTHVTRAKWVIVPSHAIGRTLGERIALSRTNWLNLRFVTPLDLPQKDGYFRPLSAGEDLRVELSEHLPSRAIGGRPHSSFA